ncbi:MAG: glycogen synthase GlgA [Nitrospinae bacterium]|nr:glycogen synthase GlgA [Nitrospinota bacterium]
MKVVIASSEMRPFAKTGGLSDVVAGLSLAEARLGVDVLTIIPLYASVDRDRYCITDTGKFVDVTMGEMIRRGTIFEGISEEGLKSIFIGSDEYFDRESLYGSPRGDYKDNDERFSFFSLAILETLKLIGFTPDVIHLNDWQTALVPLYLKTSYKDDPFFKKTSTLFTIHNLAYQGLFPKPSLKKAGIGEGLFTSEGVEFYGQVNFIKGGLLLADILNTVSRRYSLEIQEQEFGAGLEGLLKRRRDDLHGVVNGIDIDCWNPERDPLIPQNYSISDISGKRDCKMALLAEFGFKGGRDWPLMGMVSRLIDQKGFDLLLKVMDRLMEIDVRLVILGSGEGKYEQALTALAEKYRDRLGVVIGFDDPLAHRIEAGADIFLMPSYYEPCGLNQMYSLRYGTVPIVRDVGGLSDTVEDYRLKGGGTGIKFSEYNEESLLAAIREGLKLYHDKKTWRGIIRRGMKKDFSWGRAAREYIGLYRLAMAKGEGDDE